MTDHTKQIVLKTLKEISDEMATRDETRYLAAMVMAISAVKNEPRPDWTPCADGMPEKLTSVALTIDTGEGTRSTMSGYYSLGEQWMGDNYEEINYPVIAWQPLPKPWTGGLDGK